MRAAVEAAVIAAGATATVGITGFIANMVATAKTVAGARRTARDERLWAKEAALYEELLADCSQQRALREEHFRMLRYPEETEQERAEQLRRKELDWFALEGRLHAYSSHEILAALTQWRETEEAAILAMSSHEELRALRRGADHQEELKQRQAELYREAQAKRAAAEAAFNTLVDAVRDTLNRRK